MKKVNAELVKRNLVNDCLGIFTFKLDKKISFKPGQFNGVSLINKDGTKITRSYSIASTVNDLPNIEFLVRFVKHGGKREDGEGQFTHELFSRQPDKLKFEMLEKGMGELNLKKNETRNVIFISTGTGLAPFISILRTARDNEQNLDGSILIQGLKNKDDLAYVNELNEISTKTGLKLMHVESRGSCNNCNSDFNYVCELFFNRNKENKSRVTLEEIKKAIEEKRLENIEITKFLDSEFNNKNYIVMLCGNPSMINNMTTLLVAHGFVDKKEILSERYWVV
jgi:ferredoxin-NADP reductase